MDLKTTIGILTLCVMTSACGGSSRQFVRLHDIDPTLGERYEDKPSINAFYDHDGANGPERAEFGVTWVDLCRNEKRCSENGRHYSSVFRDVAITSATLMQIEFTLAFMDGGALTPSEKADLLPLIHRHAAELPRRLEILTERLARLEPMRDFGGQKKLVALATRGREAARPQLQHVRDGLSLIATLIEPAVPSVRPEQSELFVEFKSSPLELDPALERRVTNLRTRMLDQREDPNSEIPEEDELVAVALNAGLDLLDEQLQLNQQFDPMKPRLLIAVTSGPKGAVLHWYNERRGHVEQCFATAGGKTATVAALYGADGAVTAVQITESRLEPDAARCLKAALAQGALAGAGGTGGTLTIQLQEEAPTVGMVEVNRADLSATGVVSRAESIAAELLFDAADRITQASESTPTTAQNSPYALDTSAKPAPSAPVPSASKTAAIWSLLGAGSSSLVAGWVLGIAALETKSQTEAMIDAGRIREVEALAAEKRFNRLGTWSIVTGSAGLAMIGVSIASLVFRAKHGRSEVGISSRGVSWATQF